MNNVEKIINRNTFSFTIGKGEDAVTYRLRKFTSGLAIQLEGLNAFGLVNASANPDKRKAETENVANKTKMESVRKVLLVGMVTPKLAPEGEPSNAETDTVAFEDMGEDVWEIFSAIMGTGGNVENFSKQSSASGGIGKG